MKFRRKSAADTAPEAADDARRRRAEDAGRRSQRALRRRRPARRRRRAGRPRLAADRARPRAASCGCRSTRPPAGAVGDARRPRRRRRAARLRRARATATCGARCGPQIAADMAQRGGTATEREGRFGTELVCELQVQRPEGSAAQQPRASSASTARAGCCAPPCSARPASTPTAPATGRTLLDPGRRAPRRAARCRSASRCRWCCPRRTPRRRPTGPGRTHGREEPAAAHASAAGPTADDQHARDLRATYVGAGDVLDRRRPRPRAGDPARHPPHGHAAPARRRTRPRGRALRRLRRDHHRLARPAPDRRHRPGPRRCRSRAASASTTAHRIIYNPRYELMSRERASRQPGLPTGRDGRDRRGGGPRADGQGARRAARHGRGRRPGAALHRALAAHQGAAASPSS